MQTLLPTMQKQKLYKKSTSEEMQLMKFQLQFVHITNMLGLTFNNTNWKHILKTTHISILSLFILLPLL